MTSRLTPAQHQGIEGLRQLFNLAPEMFNGDDDDCERFQRGVALLECLILAVPEQQALARQYADRLDTEEEAA